VSTVVTGACGFVGCNLVEHLLATGRAVVAIDRSKAWPADAEARFAALPGQLTFAPTDVRDPEALERAFADAAASSPQGIEGVLHCAAITPGLERETRDADLIMQVNLLGTLRVLEAARDHGARRVVYPSSASVYGAAAYPGCPLEEGRDTPVPDTMYGIAKYAAERAALRARELWSMDVIAARVGAAFGPWERDTGVRDTLSGPMLATRALVRGERVHLPRAGPSDWVYAPDVAAALVALLDADVLEHELYHVSGGGGWSLADWCRRLDERLGAHRFCLDPAVTATLPLPARDRDPLAIDRLRAHYLPRYGLEAAMDDYLAWLEARTPAWHAAWCT